MNVCINLFSQEKFKIFFQECTENSTIPDFTFKL
nr:MAG TPA: hypothetical protein [Caudoviricetes sp.]